MSRYITFLLILFFTYTTPLLAQQTYKWVSVKKGEGLNAFLLRNQLKPKQYTLKFKELNKNRFTKSGHLIAGKKYKVPLLYPNHKISLLGSKHENIKQVDNVLSGAVIHLLAGHGGPDPGAVGKVSGNKICEDEYAYDIVLRMGKELIAHGAKVHFIIQDKNDGIRDAAYLKPDKDEYCFPNLVIPKKQTPRLRQRAAAVNMLAKKEKAGTYQRLIVLHLDSRSKSNRTDVYFYHHASSKKGKKLALTLQNKMKAKYAKYQPNRKYTGTIGARRLYVLKTTISPSVFVELGNINNYRDQIRFTKAGNRQALAEWLCEGIIDDYKSNKKK
ncbi:N-acetylmuramoyl-L-alanine amidase family protein [Marinifilum sp. RC60d5]|uniref:N-acetylmuramoyl-L-alanine amidase family protein n=1 Tax=Marinifilum sp. RC60d5 TaxID=3458414 RepID=UPI00403544F6